MISNDDVFDGRIRQQHAQALAQVSARTEAQLVVRRYDAAATIERSPTRALAWVAAAGAAGVLVASLQWRRPEPAPIPPHPAIAAVSADEFGSVYSALDEAPDLYLWLASSDAATLAME